MELHWQVGTLGTLLRWKVWAVPYRLAFKANAITRISMGGLNAIAVRGALRKSPISP